MEQSVPHGAPACGLGTGPSPAPRPLCYTYVE